MYFDRRQFLLTAGVSVASATIAAGGHATSEVSLETSRLARNESIRWNHVRDQFDELTRDTIHLSSFFLVSHPRPVRDAIESHRRGIDADPFTYIEKNIFVIPGKIQAAAAEYLGGKAEEVALTNSTTMGLAFIYQGLPLSAGHEILTTTHDHFVHHESIRLAAERAGASVKKDRAF